MVINCRVTHIVNVINSDMSGNHHWGGPNQDITLFRAETYSSSHMPCNDQPTHHINIPSPQPKTRGGKIWTSPVIIIWENHQIIKILKVVIFTGPTVISLTKSAKCYTQDFTLFLEDSGLRTVQALSAQIRETHLFFPLVIWMENRRLLQRRRKRSPLSRPRTLSSRNNMAVNKRSKCLTTVPIRNMRARSDLGLRKRASLRSRLRACRDSSTIETVVVLG